MVATVSGKDKCRGRAVLASLAKPLTLLMVWLSLQGHPTSIFGKYLFGRPFEI